MSSGRSPERLAAVLSLYRELADEIVVAVEEPRAAGTHAAVARVADRVLAFPPTSPSDRPIAWLFRQCAGDWILNVDDDEIPSPRLFAELAAVLARDDVTHAWIARRWLYPSTREFLDEPPWSNEFQLRLVLADDRFTQFSDMFHLPVIAHGPGVYVDAPLWHLDTALNSTTRRRAKAEAYELERPGMRIGGRSHNHALYVPELVPAPRIAPVPDDDAAQIERVLRGEQVATAGRSATLEHVASASVDAEWPGPPFDETLYGGTIEPLRLPPAMRAGVQETLDAAVTNRSATVWRWGKDARPRIRLGYRWGSGDEAVQEPLALRTVLPADLPPGQTQVIPVHVVPPRRPGSYTLTLEILHEDVVGPFAASTPVALEVRERERVALIGGLPEVMRLLARLSAPPAVEPVVVLGNDSDRAAFGDYACVSGLRSLLLDGLERSGRVATTFRLAGRSLRVVRRARSREGSTGLARLDALLDVLRDARGLFVADTDWPADAAPGREWWRLVTTMLVARAAGCPVYVDKRVVPTGHGLRASVTRRLLARIASPIGSMTLAHPGTPPAAAHGDDGAEALRGALV